MPKQSGKQSKLRLIALQRLQEIGESMEYGELKQYVMEKSGESDNSVDAAIWNLDDKFPEQVVKPERGIIQYVGVAERVSEEEEVEIWKEVPPYESSLYEPFANWLLYEMEECTRAIPLGGSKFGPKWGTPDVIGVRISQRGDIVEFPDEVITAEIKLDSNSLIVGFGQACAYRLFSHKVYLVIPENSAKDDIRRLDTLCQLFGLGLVLFEIDSSMKPKFKIRARPHKHEPDFFYVNQYLSKVKNELFG